MPWDVQRKKKDVVKYLRERSVVVPEESVLSREELRRPEARRLNVPNQSLLRTKNALEKAILKAKAKHKNLFSQKKEETLATSHEIPRSTFPSPRERTSSEKENSPIEPSSCRETRSDQTVKSSSSEKKELLSQDRRRTCSFSTSSHSRQGSSEHSRSGSSPGNSFSLSGGTSRYSPENSEHLRRLDEMARWNRGVVETSSFSQFASVEE